MPLASGSRLGPYEILSPLGSGGMGEVYRARDSKLGRDVAIKIVSDGLGHDPERGARFRREAQLLAALNHPHIAAIYGLEEANPSTGPGQAPSTGSGQAPSTGSGQAVQFLVLELVEGETLAQRLARAEGLRPRRAPAALAGVGSSREVKTSSASGGGAPRAVDEADGLPLSEALTIARQVADALQAAHEKGIIHRDLKPANIAFTAEGQVKVLDFGLAKALDPVAQGFSPADANSPTLSLAATQAGMILGTAAYMSPEQAKGRGADKRCDVWAFGCVLYEMLTGRRAFEGEDVSDTLAAVLRGEPDWAALPSNVPPSIRTLVKRCLEKDRKQRIADIAAALFVIDEQATLEPAAATTAGAAANGQPQPLWRRTASAAAIFVVGTAVASGAWWSFRPSTPQLTITRFLFTLAEGQQLDLAGQRVVAISPDGRQMVYAANNRLYLRAMSELEARPIPGTESPQGIASPVFSPDGQSIAFWGTGQTLKRIAVSGGAAVTICPTIFPAGMSWGKDGIVFGGQAGTGIMRVSPTGGTPERLVSVNASELAFSPQILPDGQTVLFTLATGLGAAAWDKAQIVAQSLRSGERKTLIEGGSDARYLPTGHLVYVLGGTLFAVPFDLRRLEVTGGPVPIVEGVKRGGITRAGGAQFSVSSTGSLVYIPGPTATSNVLRAFVLADRAGATEPLKLPPGAYVYPRVSPDGTRLAFGTDDGKEANIWIYELSGASAPRRITFSGKSRFPVWSGDGQRVAFQWDREGDLGLFWQRADGVGAAERLTKGEQGASHVPESWSRDGKHLLFTVAQGSTFTLWTFALDERKATPFGDVRSDRPIGAVFSPDGQWVAYTSLSAGPVGIGGYVQPFPATGARYQIPKLYNDYHLLWASDGKELFYIPAARRFAAVSVRTQPSVTFGNPVEMTTVAFTQSYLSTDVRNYDLMPSGKFVALVDPQAQSRSGTSVPREIQVVLNWFEELKQRVPVTK